MLNSKQRSYLRSLANNITPIFQIGKNGIEQNLLNQIDDALEVRELIKINVLNNSGLEMREVSDVICEVLHCDGVQIIGKRLVLYRKSSEKPQIELP
jgi:RNA-binding protein